MIRIEIGRDELEIFGPLPQEFVKLISRLAGRKRWIGGKKVFVEASNSNVKIIKASGFEIDWTDVYGKMKEIYELELMQTQHSNAASLDAEYVPAVPYLKHMKHCLGLSWQRKAYALLLEMGLCKTSITIHNFGMLYKKGKITGVLIWAPKGVHMQWIADQIPEHLDKSIRMNLILWDKKAKYSRKDLCVEGRLNIFALNIDSVRTEAGAMAAAQFVRYHEGHVFVACDESHNFGNYGSARTQAAIQVAHHCDYRRILTGTPISTSLEDMYSQFLVIDPDIFGITTLTAFRAQYCQMGGFEGRQVVASKNIEHFYQVIAPHSYRLTKGEATDLPPKMMMKREYEMDEKTGKLYRDMKNTYMYELDNKIIDAANFLGCVIKLQQLLSGYITVDKETKELQMISTQRAAICVDMLSQIMGQCIVFCSFIPDRQILADMIRKQLKEEPAFLENYQDYQSRKRRILIINQAACAGLNLQFDTSGDNNSIFYNNSRRSIHRWQAEDRNWRTGSAGTTKIWDIICRKSVDIGILKRLKENKDLLTLAFDDIRMIIGETYLTEYERAE